MEAPDGAKPVKNVSSLLQFSGHSELETRLFQEDLLVILSPRHLLLSLQIENMKPLRFGIG